MAKIKINDQAEVEPIWTEIKKTVRKIEKNDIGYAEEKSTRMDDTRDLSAHSQKKERKDHAAKYCELNRSIRNKCREAKELWFSKKCKEIEALQEKYDTFNLHKKVKEITGKHRKQQSTILRSANNEIILGVEAKLQRWTVYIEQLFNDNRPSLSHSNDKKESGPKIKSEVIHAINVQKNGKATSPEKIHAEVLKLIAEQEGRGLIHLISLFNRIYSTGEILTDWQLSSPYARRSNLPMR